MIIGVCGLIGSGKDTIADYLVNFHEFRRESFASTLKDAVSAVFGWDRIMVEGRTREAREWREKEDQWWSERLGMHITPRWILQYWGTEVCRNAFHDEIWIASLENKLRHTKDDIVISDCRFPNEVKAIKDQGGYILSVVRGAQPQWFMDVRKCLDENTPLPKDLPHESEWAWANTKFDFVITNDGTVDELYTKINELITDLRDQESDHPVSTQLLLDPMFSDS
jgi:hypothetical protein